jgi:hypothetical protein|tara:strand:- start:288 stop:548 length:261 start_codon:yes stop_codon:yes gene_type:complete
MRGALSPLVTSRTSVRGCIRARHPCAEAEVATEVHVEDRGARLRPAPRNARACAAPLARVLEAPRRDGVGHRGLALEEGDLRARRV